MGNYLTLIDECQGFSISNLNILRYLTNSFNFKVIRKLVCNLFSFKIIQRKKNYLSASSDHQMIVYICVYMYKTSCNGSYDVFFYLLKKKKFLMDIKYR